MSKVVILTDSTAYLPDELVAEYNIRVLPLAIIWEGVS
jgi:fatty acid-binding protein DegV